jgi:hypothetical protein
LKDISRKIHSTVKARRERGDYTGSQAPFGYIKMDGNKSKLEPDPETAPILREIFEWRAAGVGRAEICKRLDSRGILTPTEKQRQERGAFVSDFFKSKGWREATIKGMIRNSIYIGVLSQGKHNQRLYEHKPCTPVPQSEWVITENAHEPIVSRELWEAANKVETTTQVAYAKCGRRDDLPDNIFQGFTICGVCGTKIPRQYSTKVMVSGKVWESYYHTCPLHRQHPADQPFRSIRSDALYEKVFPLVANQLLMASNMVAIMEKRSKRQDNPRAALDAEISRVAQELEANNDRLARLYEDYADKTLTEQEYVRHKTRYEQKAVSLRQRADELSQRAAVIGNVSESNNRWLAAARSFQNPSELTREMLEAIVDRIVIKDINNINIVWKFKDELDILKSCTTVGEEVS